MTNKTDTQIGFEEELKRCEIILDDSVMKFSDARMLLDKCSNLLIRYEQIRKSRDKWRERYERNIQNK